MHGIVTLVGATGAVAQIGDAHTHVGATLAVAQNDVAQNDVAQNDVAQNDVAQNDDAQNDDAHTADTGQPQTNTGQPQGLPLPKTLGDIFGKHFFGVYHIFDYFINALMAALLPKYP